MMDHAYQHLDRYDRTQLLCWLACGSLAAYYLDGTWPESDFHVEAAHKWLHRHRRHGDWLATAQLTFAARRIAQVHQGIVDREWVGDAVNDLFTEHDLNYDCELVKVIYDDCRRAIAIDPHAE
ncbi:hypothetical protein [Caballeronia telluris]|jgi:hypothetical protein|uniref:Uncharacterized protein n=1 Tax=Caballeronia telluris TaxID=326475 RepID=A0A158INR2_9BURK|nr:hypothetical protein [Caballeronia telluris]SAL58198.1 hypothetical protein AWB66_03229 [Caballeronia telluris]SAL58268.1 hypothetical protein AWB66_03237 [Caballeronia telluris]